MAMPSSSNVATAMRRAVAMPSTSAETMSDMTMAPAIVAQAGSWLVPARVITRAAPKAAAGETPRVKGLTSGLRSSPCMSTPETDSAAPAVKASSTRGRRSWVITA